MSGVAPAKIARLKEVSLPSVIGQSLPLQKVGRHFVARCPFHGERSPSFTVYDEHYHCFGCGAHGDVFTWLKDGRRLTFPQAVEFLGGTLTEQPPHPTALEPPLNHPTRSTADAARRCWSEAVDPRGTMVEAYLQARGGLSLPLDVYGDPVDVIRFHPHCRRGPVYSPAMVALLTNPMTGEPTGVHRTFLDGAAKAMPLTINDIKLGSKMVLGRWGVIRLTPDEEVTRALGLAEGVENALTIKQVAGWATTWAAGCSHVIRSFPLIYGIEALTIFSDAGLAGRTAAHACGKRWIADYRECTVFEPRRGYDWNSVHIAAMGGHANGG